jgi:hypothetical protein
MKRRNVLVAFASGMTATPGFGFPVCTDRENEVCNVTRLYSAQMQKLVVIRDIQDIQRVLKSDLSKISIGGGRYSMGGQTAITGGVQVDMRSLNRLLWLKAPQKLVRVQAGMRWRDLQEILDPLGLSVQTMQSYANFTAPCVKLVVTPFPQGKPSAKATDMKPKVHPKNSENKPYASCASAATVHSKT